MKTTKCSIIIPHYNQVNDLKVCLDALKKHLDPSQLEVIIVDNASTDPNYKALELEFPEFTFLSETTKKNPYTCRNTGITASKGEYIALLDAKCKINLDWVEKVLLRLETGQSIYAGRYRLISESSVLRDKVYGILYLNTDRNVKYGYGVTASNLIVKRSVIERIGNFQDVYQSGNDIMWSRRALQQGYVIQYCPEIIVQYPAQSWDVLSEKIKKYAAGVRFHQAMNTNSLFRQFLPMKYSTFHDSLTHRGLMELTIIEKVKLWWFVWQMKIRFALAYLSV